MSSRVKKRVDLISWIIICQIFFPLSISFTPVIAAAKNVQNKAVITSTEIYTLGTNEHIDSVAKKYHITVSELEKINSYRTFSKPFALLTTGDEIDIPRNRSPFSVDQPTVMPADTVLSGHLVTGANILSSENTAESVEQMALSVANSEVNNATHQWLSQFGTARVQLNINKDAHLAGSEIDLLLPLYDNQTNLLFTQLGARNKESRNTLNAGLGWRLFQADWMFGVNTFFDNDISGNNRRAGVGAEMWTDYIKLSTNHYIGLTDWHQSRDFSDYDERPANGYDIRAEAYLPTHNWEAS